MKTWKANGGAITISGGATNGAFYDCGINRSNYGNSYIMNMIDWSAYSITISGGVYGAF